MDPNPAMPVRAHPVDAPEPVAHVVAPHGDDTVDLLVAAARRVLDSGEPAVIVCDVGALHPGSWSRDCLRTVDLLVRLQLDARRRGCEIRLSRAGAESRRLLDLLGMTAILPDHPHAEQPGGG